MEGGREGEKMAYGINSSIQAQRLTDEVGQALKGIAISIPLQAKKILISLDCIAFMSLTETGLTIPEQRMSLPQQKPDGSVTNPSPPICIPIPSGANGQLWFQANTTGGLAPAPESYVAVLILDEY